MPSSRAPGIVSARHVELVVATVPGCAVDHAAIGREAGVADGAGAEGDLLVFGERTCALPWPSHQPRAKHSRGDNESGREQR